MYDDLKDIYVKGGKPFLLEATLSLRNSDPKEDIAFVRYYDTNGKLIKDYLEKPMLLKSLATAEFLVAQKEIEGASSANLSVEWISDTRVNKPVIETVMTVNCATLKPAAKKEHRLTGDNGMSATNNKMLTFLDKEYENG